MLPVVPCRSDCRLLGSTLVLLGFLDLLLVGACSLQAPPHEAVPVLRTDGTNIIRIDHPGLGASWNVHLPEDVESFTTVYLTDKPKRVIWEQFAGGAIGYDWELPSGAVPEVGDNLSGFPLGSGLRVSVRLTPGPGQVGIRIELANHTESPIENLISYGGCLQHQSPQFFDDEGSRSFMRTEDGMTALSTTDRTHPTRCLYLVHRNLYEVPMIQAWESHWGRSNTRPTTSLVAVSDKQKTAAIGIGFEQALSVSHSGAPQNCVHSGIDFGNLAPGETVARRGVILFGHSVEELFDRFDRLGFSPATSD